MYRQKKYDEKKQTCACWDKSLISMLGSFENFVLAKLSTKNCF
jgi:hypothetical protein